MIILTESTEAKEVARFERAAVSALRAATAAGGQSLYWRRLRVRFSIFQMIKEGVPPGYSFLYGPSGAIRTRGLLLPKQAPYRLGYTRE